MLLRSGHFYFSMDSTTSTTLITPTTTTATTTTATTTTTSVLVTTTSTIPSVLPPNTSTSGLGSQFPANMSLPTIKLLHQDPSIKKFSGEDDTYTALQFLRACEDQMVNTNISTGADKMSFVRSQLTPNSLASDMMLAHAFDPKALNHNFDQFRKNFLEAFDSAQTQGSFQWIFQLADTLPSDLSSLGRMRGQSRAATLASEAITSLKASSCINNDTISTEHLRSLLEFQYFIMYLTPQERRVASSLDFKPGDSVLRLASKINQKLKVLPPSCQVVASVTKASPVTSTPASSASERPSITNACSYCNKPGHRWERCFKRLRKVSKSSPISSSSQSSRYDSSEDLPLASQGQASSHQRSRFNRSPSRSPARLMKGQSYHSHASSCTGKSSTHMNLERPPFNCLIHGPCSHSSEECRAIRRMQKQQTATVSNTQSNFCPSNTQSNFCPCHTSNGAG